MVAVGDAYSHLESSKSEGKPAAGSDVCKCVPLFSTFSRRMYPLESAVLLDVRRRQIVKGSVICLQEVGIEWAGDLHVYFMARGYSFVTAHYGKRFNNYMGERSPE